MDAQIINLAEWKAAHPPSLQCWNAAVNQSPRARTDEVGYLNLRPFLFLHQVRLNQIAEIIEAHDVTSPWRIHLG